MNLLKNVETDLIIEKERKESFNRGKFNVKCVRGILWLTWPGSGDIILKSGDQISFRNEGILCITAMTGALVNIHMSMLMPGIKEIPGLLFGKSFKTVFSFMKNEDTKSVFGDSVHSITR